MEKKESLNLSGIPGVGRIGAHIILSEIGDINANEDYFQPGSALEQLFRVEDLRSIGAHGQIPGKGGSYMDLPGRIPLVAGLIDAPNIPLSDRIVQRFARDAIIGHIVPNQCGVYGTFRDVAPSFDRTSGCQDKHKHQQDDPCQIFYRPHINQLLPETGWIFRII